MRIESLNIELNPEFEKKTKEELLPFTFIAKLKTSLREKLDPSDDPESAEQMRELIEMKVNHLESVYPNYKTFQTYYLLKNIPVPQTCITQVDFPGNDSVVEFIEGF
jgi:hypothetical protein